MKVCHLSTESLFIGSVLYTFHTPKGCGATAEISHLWLALGPCWILHVGCIDYIPETSYVYTCICTERMQGSGWPANALPLRQRIRNQTQPAWRFRGWTKLKHLVPTKSMQRVVFEPTGALPLSQSHIHDNVHMCFHVCAALGAWGLRHGKCALSGLFLQTLISNSGKNSLSGMRSGFCIIWPPRRVQIRFCRWFLFYFGVHRFYFSFPSNRSRK